MKSFFILFLLICVHFSSLLLLIQANQNEATSTIQTTSSTLTQNNFDPRYPPQNISPVYNNPLYQPVMAPTRVRNDQKVNNILREQQDIHQRELQALNEQIRKQQQLLHQQQQLLLKLQQEQQALIYNTPVQGVKLPPGYSQINTSTDESYDRSTATYLATGLRQPICTCTCGIPECLDEYEVPTLQPVSVPDLPIFQPPLDPSFLPPTAAPTYVQTVALTVPPPDVFIFPTESPTQGITGVFTLNSNSEDINPPVVPSGIEKVGTSIEENNEVVEDVKDKEEGIIESDDDDVHHHHEHHEHHDHKKTKSGIRSKDNKSKKSSTKIKKGRNLH